MKKAARRISAILLSFALIAAMMISTAVSVSAVNYSGSSSYQSGKYYRALKNVKLTGNQRTDIVNVAKSQIGYQEGSTSSQLSGEVRGNGNKTEYGRWYGIQDMWCAMFVSWCANAAGVSTSVVPKHSYTPSGLSWFKSRGLAYSRATVAKGGYTPQPGDIIYFKSSRNTNPTNHIGIVTGYSNKTVYTVEGNTSSATISTNGGAVAAKSYSISNTYIVYICKPNYSGTSIKTDNSNTGNSSSTSGSTSTSGNYYAKCSSSCQSIVDGLNSIGVDSSKENRTKIAAANGINNYSGTADQNTQLLTLLKSGKLVKPSSSSSTTGGSTAKVTATAEQMAVIRKIIYAVETGGQVYGNADYSNFTEAYANSSAEHAITIGAGQWYATEAKTLLNLIRSTDKATFEKLDTAGIGTDLDTKDWSTYQLSKTSAKAKCIQSIISSAVGKQCQDKLVENQMKTYMQEAADLGVTDVDAQMMCANFRHQGGKGAVTRILGKTTKPYTLDKLYASCKTDTGNQVGAYKSRQLMVYNSLKKYITNASSDSSTTPSSTIKLDKSSATLTVGSSLTLKATCSGGTPLWSSNNVSVAIVTSAGKVTAVKAGTATITAKLSDGTSAVCKITVTDPANYYPKCSSSYSSLVDALNSIGVDSSKENRTNIAAANGIANYSGTADQNTKLLTLLKNGKLIKAAVSAPIPTIKLDKTSASINVGSSLTLTATASSGTVTWSSSNTAVATVTSTGKINAVKTGTTTITAKLSDGTSASCKITVTAAITYYPKCSSSYVSLVDALTSIGVDSSKTNRTKIAALNGISSYSGTADQNTKLLTLLKNGKLVKSSTTDVTPTIKLDKTSASLKTGSSLTLTATSTGGTVTWSSSDTTIATVSSTGKVTAVKAGTVTITAKLSNGTSASCKITITVPITYYKQCSSSYVSIVDALASIGVDSSKENRTIIASANGISNYTGTADQNTKLLTLLKNGKLIKPATAASAPTISLSKTSATVSRGSSITLTATCSSGTPTWSSSDTSVATVTSTGKVTAVKYGTATITAKLSTGQTATCKITVPVSYYKACSSSYTSIVDALNSIDVDSSMTNRKKIATANGISSYSGTSAQNTKMLDLLKSGKLIKP